MLEMVMGVVCMEIDKVSDEVVDMVVNTEVDKVEDMWLAICDTYGDNIRGGDGDDVHEGWQGGQIFNKCKWCHLVAKFADNASGATWWPNLQLMQE